MDENCVDRRLVPMRQCGTEYRLAPHRARNGAEDSRQRQERSKCFPEALTAEDRKGAQKDESAYDAEQNLPRIEPRRDCAFLRRGHWTRPMNCA
jgi:hypothetical protein